MVPAGLTVCTEAFYRQ